jgi:RNA polymerase sigma-70 factor (ECF subfamily)
MEWMVALAPTSLPLAQRRAVAAHRREATGGRGAVAASAGETGDDVLVRRIGAGDQRAFAEIVRRHGGRLRALALRFTGGATEADDIVQETFWSLWRNAGRWQPGGPPFAAYLTRMAMNRAIDADRRRRLRRYFGLEEANERADPEPAADARLGASKELTAVTRDNQGLPLRQRAAILLAAERSRTNAEIAEAMGLSVGAVEQLLVRARRTLRARLAARDEAAGDKAGG